MRMFNWAKSFEEQPTCEDILKRVRKTETTYWIFIVIFALMLIHGFNTINEAPEDNLKQHVMGLFLALFGIIHITLMKIWAHIRLTMYFLIWDSKNRIENEIRKSEALDL